MMWPIILEVQLMDVFSKMYLSIQIFVWERRFNNWMWISRAQFCSRYQRHKNNDNQIVLA